jgi:hypothetical protein
LKFFVIMLLGVAVLGAGLGGGAVAWTILSDDGSSDVAAVDFPRPTVIATPQVASETVSSADTSDAEDSSEAPSTSAVQVDSSGLTLSATDGPTQEQLAALRERFQSGEVTEEELAELREQFQGGGGFGGGGFGSFAGGFTPMVGAIESIDGSLVSVGTADGVLTAMVGGDVTVSISSETGVEGLELGQQVSVIGERDETGSFMASAITVVTEGGAFGGGRTGGQRQGGFGGGGGGLGGTRALTGTVDSIEEGRITIETEQGPLPVAVNDDTTVRITSLGTIGDLELGMNVVIIGQPDEDGQVVATSVNVVPEGVTQGLGGAGGFFGGRQRPGGQTSP